MLSVKWQLLHGVDQNSTLSLSLRLVPTPELKEKLGDVWIGIKKFVLKGAKGESDLTADEERTIVLKKSTLYTVDLIRPNQLLVNESQHSLVIVEIYLLRNTLQIIEKVEVPPCSALLDFRQLLVLDKSESESKFCDLTLTVKPTKQESENVESGGNRSDAKYEEKRSNVESGDNSSDIEYDEKRSNVESGGNSSDVESDDNSSDGQLDFYAHKAVLAARSPVFAAMFSHQMKETVTATITLTDIEPDELQQLLLYIYTGSCPNIKSYAESLLHQAEKYRLTHLKALCERHLSYNLQISNAAKILILADMHSAEKLKRNALLYIERHGSEVRLTEEWKDVIERNDLLQALINTRYGAPEMAPASKKPKLQ